MKQMLTSIAIALFLSFGFVLILSKNNPIVGQSDSHSSSLNHHLQEFNFRVPVAADFSEGSGFSSPAIELPVKDHPVRLVLSIPSVEAAPPNPGGPIRTMPVLVEATVMYDSGLGYIVSRSSCLATDCSTTANFHVTLPVIGADYVGSRTGAHQSLSVNVLASTPQDTFIVNVTSGVPIVSDHFDLAIQMWY